MVKTVLLLYNFPLPPIQCCSIVTGVPKNA